MTAAARPGAGRDLLDALLGLGDERGPQQEVLGRIAGDRQLGERDEVAAVGFGPLVRLEDARRVALEVADDEVQLREGNPKPRHASRIRPGRRACRTGSAGEARRCCDRDRGGRRSRRRAADRVGLEGDRHLAVADAHAGLERRAGGPGARPAAAAGAAARATHHRRRRRRRRRSSRRHRRRRRRSRRVRGWFRPRPRRRPCRSHRR